jgi:hypothetical protein
MNTIRFALLSLLAVLGTLAGVRPAQADTSTFTLHKAMDTGGTSHLAMTYLVPKGWKADDIVHWDINDRSGPLLMGMTATSADGRYKVQWINQRSFSYPGPDGRGLPAPARPTDSLVDVFKKGHPGVDVDVVTREETPTTSIFKSNPNMQAQAYQCSVVLRYVLNGVPMETKSGYHYDGWEAPHFHTGTWRISDITSITGPQDQFPKAMRLGAVVLSSQRWDPQFSEQYLDVINMLLKETRAAGQAYLDAQFAALRQHFHDLSESNRVAFEAQEAAKDKNTRDFCDYVLDRERYTDGHTEFILPSGYSRAATNGTDYVLTDDPGYRAQGDWHELNKTR